MQGGSCLFLHHYTEVSEEKRYDNGHMQRDINITGFVNGAVNTFGAGQRNLFGGSSISKNGNTNANGKVNSMGLLNGSGNHLNENPQWLRPKNMVGRY